MLNAREPGRMMLPLSQQSENAFCTFGVAKEVPAVALIKEFNVLMENRSGTPLPRLAFREVSSFPHGGGLHALPPFARRHSRGKNGASTFGVRIL